MYPNLRDLHFRSNSLWRSLNVLMDELLGLREQVLHTDVYRVSLSKVFRTEIFRTNVFRRRNGFCKKTKPQKSSNGLSCGLGVHRNPQCGADLELDEDVQPK